MNYECVCFRSGADVCIYHDAIVNIVGVAYKQSVPYSLEYTETEKNYVFLARIHFSGSLCNYIFSDESCRLTCCLRSKWLSV